MGAWLATFFATLTKQLLPSLIEWVKAVLLKIEKARLDKIADEAYDKRMTEATEAYKKAQTNEEQDAAFKNLISTARRH